MRSGSLPDLAGLGARSTPPPPAHGERARTLSGSDNHRTVRRTQAEHRRDTLHQINVNQVTTVTGSGAGGDWHRGPRTSTGGAVAAARRRESVASSVGAASVRRLLSRAPPARVPPVVLRRYTALCFARACTACALIPFTALLGGGDGGGGTGALALALLHFSAAISAPLAPILLRRISPAISLAITHVPIALLLISYAAEAPGAAVFALHMIAGVGLGPYALTTAAAATSTAGALAGGVREEEPRRRALVRRTLRGLRIAQDIGMLVGVLLLGTVVTLSGSSTTSTLDPPLAIHNHTEPRWPPEPYILGSDYPYDEDEAICGASGCPDAALPAVVPVSAFGRHVLAVCWATLGVLACALGALCRPTPPTAAELATSQTAVLKDRKLHLVMPLALFIGLQQGFIYTSYIRWFAVCVKGWEAAWIVLAGVGALSAVAAVTVSMAAARGGKDGRQGRRGALAGGGAAAHACLLLALLLWRAARTDAALPAVAAAAWGACGALWDTLQVAAVVGSGGLFGNAWRPAWAYITGVRHLGIALSCMGRMYVCVNVQLAVLTCSLVLGALGHAGLEYKTRPPAPCRVAASVAVGPLPLATTSHAARALA